MTGEPTHTTSKVSWAPVYQLSSEKQIKTCFQPVRTKKYLKSNCVIKVTSMKNTKKFPLQRGSHHVQPLN